MFWVFLIILQFSWQRLSRDDYHIHHLHQIYLYLLVKIQLVTLSCRWSSLNSQGVHASVPGTLGVTVEKGLRGSVITVFYLISLREVAKKRQRLLHYLCISVRTFSRLQGFFQGGMNFTSN